MNRLRGAWAVDGHEIRPRERGFEIGDRLASGRLIRLRHAAGNGYFSHSRENHLVSIAGHAA